MRKIRELTAKERREIRRLVRWCANYDREYGCLPLDAECYMLGKCWTGSLCGYFEGAVLPANPVLETVPIMIKSIGVCHRMVDVTCWVSGSRIETPTSVVVLLHTPNFATPVPRHS